MAIGDNDTAGQILQQLLTHTGMVRLRNAFDDDDLSISIAMEMIDYKQKKDE